MTSFSDNNNIAKQPICKDCLNYKKDLKCSAFIDGIPDVIAFGKNDHSKPLKNQGNKIVFEKK